MYDDPNNPAHSDKPAVTKIFLIPVNPSFMDPIYNLACKVFKAAGPIVYIIHQKKDYLVLK